MGNAIPTGDDILEKAGACIGARKLAGPETPALLMVSGGSDSTALAYAAAGLSAARLIGPLAMLHVNHLLRGADSDADADFARQLADVLGIPFTCASIDVGAMAKAERGNVEAVARRERYAAARAALAGLCRRAGMPAEDGRIFVAHTADDRIESFYMRSIVGTGPGGFRSMLYLNGQVARPLLDCTRDELRSFICERAEAGLPVARDGEGAFWREDATNAGTDRFRSYVRHEVVPRAKERNPHLAATLTRTMNLIADEDDLLDALADGLVERHVRRLEPDAEGCMLAPGLAAEPVPLQRRVAVKVVEGFLAPDDRIETSAVDAVLAAFRDGRPIGGYVANIQGDLAVSANKHGVRVEPMGSFRARRKKV